MGKLGLSAGRRACARRDRHVAAVSRWNACCPVGKRDPRNRYQSPIPAKQWPRARLTGHSSTDLPHRVAVWPVKRARSEEHTSELQSPDHLVCRLLLEKKKNGQNSRVSVIISSSRKT